MSVRKPAGEPPRLMAAVSTAVALVCIILDQASKWLVTATLAPGQSATVAPFLAIVHQRNPSGAFGLFASLPEKLRLPVLLALGVVAIAAVLALSLRWLRPSRTLALLLGLVLGGALSNLGDRLWLGQVIDFIDFHAGAWRWPTFNLADTAITLGSLFLLLLVASGARRDGAEVDYCRKTTSTADYRCNQGGR